MRRMGLGLMALLCVGDSADARQPRSAAQRTPGISLSWQIAAAGAEAKKLQEATDIVDALLGSQEFWNDFAVAVAEYPRIFVGPEYRQNGLPDGLADAAGVTALLRNTGGTYHVFDAIVGLTGTYYQKGDDYSGQCTNGRQPIPCRATAFAQNYSNMMAVTHGIGTHLPSGRELVSIELGREIFARYDSPSLVRKSCTINTLAHEWTHTIGKNQPSHWTITVDTATQKPAGVPYLSQLVGSIAQCSWLQSQHTLGTDPASLNSCVRKFGVEKFQSLLCV